MPIDIACSLTKNISISLLVMMNSIACNSRDPHQLRFNVVVPAGERAYFVDRIQRGFPERRFDVRVAEFIPPPYMCGYLQNRFQPKTEQAKQGRFMQYSRLFYNQVFPDLHKTLYLDTDTLILGDVADLYREIATFSTDRLLAAVPHMIPAFMYFSNPCRIKSEIPLLGTTFNSGVMLTDFSLWTDAVYKRLAHYLELDAASNYKLFYLGDETVLNLLFQDFIPLAAKWNCCGYGNIRPLSMVLRKRLRDVAIIHWSGGHHKPWRSSNIPYGKLWQTFNRFEGS
ncbi:MAG: glycosyltransferase [Cyanobacteria bacterium P01_A01_bin.3]